jgi:hypothetical protein
MNKLYLDVEFNGTLGGLISLALYNPTGQGWYEVYDDTSMIYQEWVRINVIPKLNKKPIGVIDFAQSLREYLTLYNNYTIYADWPEDFIHLLKMCFGPMGLKYTEKLHMEMITTPDTHISKIPHNALADAEALYLNHQEMLK